MRSQFSLGLLLATVFVASSGRIPVGNAYKEAAPRTHKLLLMAADFTPWDKDKNPQNRLCMTYDDLKLAMDEGSMAWGDIGLRKAMAFISGGTVTLELTTAPVVYTLPYRYSHTVKNYNSTRNLELNWVINKVEETTDLRRKNFDTYGLVLFPMTGRPLGTAAGNTMWLYSADSLLHELLHTFGIYHAKSDDDGNAATKNDIMNYGDLSSTMGGGEDSSGLTAAQMMQKGWFPKDKITWLNVSHSGNSKRRYKLSSMDRKFRGPESPLDASDVPHDQALVLFDNPEKQYVISLRDMDKSTGTGVERGWDGVYVHFVTDLAYLVKRLQKVGQTFRPSPDDPLDEKLDWSVTLISNANNEVAEVEVCHGDCQEPGVHDSSNCRESGKAAPNCCAHEETASCAPGYRVQFTGIFHQDCYNFECINSLCFDGVKNGEETDVDCGGACRPCPTCFDGKLNGLEEEIDCGGPDCGPCRAKTNACKHRTCNDHGVCLDGECTCALDYYGDECETYDRCKRITCENGGTCNSDLTITSWDTTIMDLIHMIFERVKVCTCKEGFTGNLCERKIPSCTDGVMNGDETGPDCGGSCEPCPTCSDGEQNGNELGVDCGGACVPCPSCEDGEQNGNEEGLNCGGDCPAKCEDEPTCFDGSRNGDEEGLDCGGSCGPCHEYYYLSWSACSEQCGGGSSTRDVECVLASNQTHHVVDDAKCALLYAPLTFQTCKQHACPEYTWKASAWPSCPVCGVGGVIRKAWCYSSLGDVRVADTFCDETARPTTLKRCSTHQCDVKTFWVPGKWGPCSSCDATKAMKTRHVYCQDQARYSMPESRCPPSPITEDVCSAADLADCPIPTEWMYLDWEECTENCGGGTSNREAFCRTTDDPKVVDPSLCDVALREPLVRECMSAPCSTFHWVTTPWTTCVEGNRNRHVECLSAAGTPARDDDCEEARPTTDEQCTSLLEHDLGDVVASMFSTIFTTMGAI